MKRAGPVTTPTLDGTISDSGSITKAGDGTLLLAGADTQTGDDRRSRNAEGRRRDCTERGIDDDGATWSDAGGYRYSW